jgi:soluble lytic murein transglycosylase-like protein
MSLNRRNLAASLLISFALVVCVFSSAKAGMYQCRNADGALLFTNSPTQPGCRLLGGAYTERLPSSGSPADPTRFDGFIFSSSNRYGVDPALVRAVVKVESDFNESARSHKGAQGLMQLMPDTARLHNVADAYNPQENIEGGVRHLRLLLDQFRGDIPLTLAAYNAGTKAVERHRGIPPYSETKEYVRRVLNYHQRYSKNSPIAVNEGSRVQQQ